MTQTVQIVASTALLIYFPLLSKCLSFSDYNGCVFDLSDANGVSSTYNLSLFHLKTESFLVDDKDVEDWKYRFNVCGAIPDDVWSDVPSYCKQETGTNDPCIDINANGTCNEIYNVTKAGLTASAVQINEPHSRCHWMGVELDGLNDLVDYNVSLYDQSDSASGIKYTIFNGEWCGISGQNRELVLEFICPDSNRYYFDPSAESTIDEVVVEYPPCVYTITYESPLACPANCIATSGDEYAVCSGNGICVSDPNALSVQCLCDDGWTGDLCSVEQEYDIEIISSVHSAMITSVIICIVLLIIAISVALYLCHRIRLKEDDVAGTHGQFAQSMLDSDEIMSDPGTSMGIVSQSQSFDPRSNVDPTIQNEVAAQHAKETFGASTDDDDVLLHGTDEDDNTTNNNDNNNNNYNVNDVDNGDTTNDTTYDNDDAGNNVDDNDNNEDAGAAANADEPTDRVEADLLGTEETS